jgi:hypothetical protein
MIQRIQTLLLAFTTILLVANLFLPIWSATTKSGTVTADAFFLTFQPSSEQVKTDIKLTTKSKNVSYIAFLIIISIAFSLYTIFLYKNRLKQIKFSNFLTLLTLGIIGAYFLAIPAAKTMITDSENGNYHFAYFIPIVCNILLLTARYFIRKDELLVKSVDRVR